MSINGCQACCVCIMTCLTSNGQSWGFFFDDTASAADRICIRRVSLCSRIRVIDALRNCHEKALADSDKQDARIILCQFLRRGKERDMVKRKGILIRLATGMAVLLAGMAGISPMTVFAVEPTEDEINEEVIDDTQTAQRISEGDNDLTQFGEELSLPDSYENEKSEPKDEVPAGSSRQEAGSGDDVYIDAIFTERDEKRTAQVNMTLLLPDDLRLDVFADLRCINSHTVYRLPLYFDNGYAQRCYVEPGEYTVTNIGVYGDSTGKYSFVYPEDFSISENEVIDLYTMLADEEDVQKELDERLGRVSPSDVQEREESWGGLAEKEALTVPSDYDVEHTGTGGGMVGVKGEASREHEIVIRVCKGGIPGIMSVKYSMDGENGIWSEETAVPLAGNISLYDNSEGIGRDSGLTAHFSADPRDPESLFVEGDRYTVYIPDPSTELVIIHKGDGAAALEVHELVPGTQAFHLLYEGGHAIRVEVLRGGSFGNAVIRISSDGGKSFAEQMYLPEDGVIPLPEIGVELAFTGSDNESLMIEGDTYSIDAVKENYMPLIAGVTAFLLVALGILYWMFRGYMLRQLPGPSDYRIEPYIPYAEREKQHV